MEAVAAGAPLRRAWSLSRLAQLLLALAVTAVYLPAVADLPRVGGLMLAVQLAYGALLLLRPRLWLIVLPFVTVAIDLAPWSGRFLFSEYDGFIAVTLAASALAGRFERISGSLGWACVPLAIYVALYLFNIADLRAFIAPPGRQFVNPYYDPAYSYKVGKGLVWGLLLAWLWLGQVQRDRATTLRWSLAGAVTAAVTLVILALWERDTLAVFASADNWWAMAHSVLNFSSEYRITGIFADMHTGGEVIDGLMILLFPLLLLPLLAVRDLRSSAVLLCALLALGYCIVIGVTRATWGAAAFAFLATSLAYQRQRHHAGNTGHRHTILRTLVFVGAVMAARYLYAQGGSEALLVFGAVVGTALLVGAIERLRAPEQLVLLGAVLTIFAYLALQAHLDSRYATPDAESRVLVPVLVFLGGVGLWVFGRTASLHTLGDRLRWSLLLVALPGGIALALGSFSISDRMSSTGNDLKARMSHWQKVVDSAPADDASRWLGSGVGSFPRRYIEAYPDTLAQIGSFALPRHATPVLRLGAGSDVAVIQRVAAEPLTDYTITLRTRSLGAGELSLLLCEQNQLVFNRWGNTCAGGRTRYGRLDAPLDEQGFEAHEIAFNSGRVAMRPGWQRWPVSLHLVHLRGESPVEITDLSVRGRAGDLVDNGDFSAGLDQWFFVANFAHLPWHIKNLWLEAWYETGYLGLILLIALLLLAGLRSWSLGAQEPMITACFLAVIAVFVLGAFGSPLESSRVSTWFYLLLSVALLLPAKPASATT